MENKLINELYRINQLIGVDDVIVESVATPIVRSLQTLFSKISDDVVEKFVIKTGIQVTDDALDNIINKLRAGQPITKKSLNLLLSQIDGNKLAKIFTKSKILMGDDVYDNIIRYEKLLKSNPKKYREAIDSINTMIDNLPYLKDLPDNLKKSIKLELKGKMDNAVTIASRRKSLNFNLLRRGNIDDIISGYKIGYKSSPDVLSKIFKNVRTLHWPTSRFTSQEYKQLLVWLSTGSSRMPSEILKTFTKHGFGGGIASFGGEFVKKYFKLMFYLTMLRLSYQVIVDLTDGKENYPKNVTSLEIIWDRIKRAAYWPDAKWVIPITITWPIFETIMGPMLRGDSPWDEILKKLENKISQYQSETDEMVSQTKEEPSLTDKGELILFKRKVKSKYPNFKYSNNLKIINGVPYFVYETETYPIYNYNNEYYIKHNGDVIYLDDLTQ
jgi:hypothetical protein